MGVNIASDFFRLRKFPLCALVTEGNPPRGKLSCLQIHVFYINFYQLSDLYLVRVLLRNFPSH
jgi:hypothetical protein